MAIYLFKGKSKLERSHIGQIIMSTTLNTQAKVIEQYGGTTWTKIEGRFLLGASSAYPVSSTGGEATHTLTIDEIPNHNHAITTTASNLEPIVHMTEGEPINGYAMSEGTHWLQWGNVLSTDATGGGQAFDIMPPYKAVYIWERTA